MTRMKNGFSVDPPDFHAVQEARRQAVQERRETFERLRRGFEKSKPRNYGQPLNREQRRHSPEAVPASEYRIVQRKLDDAQSAIRRLEADIRHQESGR